MTDNTTSINDLPSDPTAGGNVQLTVTEKEPILDETTIHQLVNGLQQASATGATSLPSRDIPINTGHITTDDQSQPNYVPQPTQKYIGDVDEDMQNYYNSEKRKSSLDSLYDEIQAPLLLAVLYFLFQLPVLKKNIFKFLPFLCHNDGNYNLQGLLFTCGLFGFMYYSLSKSVTHFSTF